LTQPPEGPYSPVPAAPGDPAVTSWTYLPPAAPEPAPAPKRSRRGALIASAVAVVALAAGGVVTYAATSASSSAGSGSPQQAVQKFVDDLNQSDIVGMLDDLAPGERAALAGPVQDIISQLKQHHILSGSADAHHFTGIDVSLTNLSFAAKPITINDHVSVVELTGGHATVGADVAKIPLASQFIAAALPHGLPAHSSQTQSVDIGQAVKQNGHPIRIATEQVGGRWYPSLFYTIADNAATSDHLGNPTAADAIPAQGAASPSAAVQQELTALIGGNFRRAIELLSPDEMAALHDYGGLFLAGRHQLQLPGSGASVTNLRFVTHPVSSGFARLTLAGLDIDVHGSSISLTVKGNCVEAMVQGTAQHVCAATVVHAITGLLSHFGAGPALTAAQTTAIGDVFTALLHSSTDVSEVGGQWYVDPVRTVGDNIDSFLSGLGDNDLLALIKMVSTIAH
jgi:hypothetical protein